MHEVMVIGGGIVGLATAYRLTEAYPHRAVIVLEKEARVAAHQSGHNSCVLHSGIYYKPGSLKAATCRAGKRAMQAFCESEGLLRRHPQACARTPLPRMARWWMISLSP